MELEKINLKDLKNNINISIGVCLLFLAYFISYVMIYYGKFIKTTIPVMALVSATMCIIFLFIVGNGNSEYKRKKDIEFLREVMEDIEENKARGK